LADLDSDSPSAIAMSAFTVEKATLNQVRLENENELNQIEQILRGKEYDWGAKVWIKKGNPLMNDQGIREILMLLRLHANKMFYLSNFDEHQVQQMLYSFGIAIVFMMGCRCDTYSIDRKIRGTLTRSIENLGMAIMLRALHDKEREHMDTINKVTEHHIQRGQQQQGFGIGPLNQNRGG
jgi:hypothetical protein